MPYIKTTRREKLNPALNSLSDSIKSLAEQDLRDLDGDLNYCITKLLLNSLDLDKNPKYTKFNTAVGVLESVKLELYRRFIAPYEDVKREENGDIV